MYYQHQAQQTLPVPIGPPDQRAMVGGLPYQPPFVVPAAINPMYQQLLPIITGYTILALQNNAQKNELRSFFFNLCSRNAWNNAEFQDLVSGVATLSEYLIVVHRMQPEEAVRAAADDMTGMLTSAAAVTYQQHMGRYIQGNVANDLNMKLQRLEQVRGELHNFLQQQQAPSVGYTGYGAAPAPMYGGGTPYRGPSAAPIVQRGPTVMMGGRPISHHGAPMSNAPHAMAARGIAGSLWGDPAPPPNVSQIDSGETILRPRVRHHTVAEEVTMSPRETTPRFSTSVYSNLPDERQEVSQMKLNVPAAPATWPQMANPQKPWDGLLLEDGTEIRPAFKSGWKRTYSPATPYHFVFDNTKNFLFHVRRPDGTVHETLQELEPSMKYLQHELNPALKEAARETAEVSSTAKVAPNWALAERLRPVAKQPLAVQEPSEGGVEDLLGNREPRRIDNVFIAHSLKEAEVRLATYVRENRRFQGDGLIEYYFDQVTPVANEKVGLQAAIRRLELAQSFDDLLAKMAVAKLTLKTADPETLDIRRVIDERLTAAINAAIQKNLSLTGWAIDSYDADFQELLRVLEESYGKALVDKLRDGAPEIIGGALSTLDGEEYRSYLKSTGAGEETLSGLPGTPLIAFRDRTSITRVPWALADLHLDLSSGGLIPKTSLPELHQAVDAIFDRTNDLPVVFAKRFIQTSDRKLIEIRRGYLGDESYLLFPA